MNVRLVLGDQLTHSLSSLRDADSRDTILMCEVHQKATYVRHHKKKIAFVFSAMRHFARELEENGLRVRYTTFDAPENAGSLFGEVQRTVSACGGDPTHHHRTGRVPALECIERAEAGYREGKAPLNAVEGFIRQILGWREYFRGIYWLKMPDYVQANFLNAHRPLPAFYWNGETRMNCRRQKHSVPDEF